MKNEFDEKVERVVARMSAEFEEIKKEADADIADWKYYKPAICYELCEWVISRREEYDKEAIDYLDTLKKPLAKLWDSWCDRDDSLWEDFGYMVDNLVSWGKKC